MSLTLAEFKTNIVKPNQDLFDDFIRSHTRKCMEYNLDELYDELLTVISFDKLISHGYENIIKSWHQKFIVLLGFDRNRDPLDLNPGSFIIDDDELKFRCAGSDHMENFPILYDFVTNLTEYDGFNPMDYDEYIFDFLKQFLD